MAGIPSEVVVLRLEVALSGLAAQHLPQEMVLKEDIAMGRHQHCWKAESVKSFVEQAVKLKVELLERALEKAEVAAKVEAVVAVEQLQVVRSKMVALQPIGSSVQFGRMRKRLLL